jgi:DNA (cytosine-5)-methyltransferase 1
MINDLKQKDFDIRTLRLERGIRQRDLATVAKVSQTELSKCERGLVLPDEEFFTSIAKVLLVSSTDLRKTHSKLLETAIPGEGYATKISENSYIKQRRAQPSESIMSVMDLFCGTGGFSYGFEQTGQFQVTVGLDLLSDRIETFYDNHPVATTFCADIRCTDIYSLVEAGPKPEVIIGGPPCQGFSSIRPFRTLTEKDPRNNLFEYFALVVELVKPKWFVLENVVGLLTHRDGDTLLAILELFKEIGYHVEWKILNAALYGLPQRRERLIFVGNSIGQSFRWPEPTHYFNGRSMAGKKHGQYINQLPLFRKNLHPAITTMEAIHDLPEIQAGEAAENYREDVTLTEYEKIMRGNCKLLTLHEATKHTPHMLEIIKFSGHNRNKLPAGMTSSGFSSSYSRLEPDAPSVTLTVNFVHPASNKCIHPFQNRALTPREGARLQGFEDNYKFKGSRAQIIKQIGNAVPPLLGKVIAEALLKQI